MLKWTYRSKLNTQATTYECMTFYCRYILKMMFAGILVVYAGSFQPLHAQNHKTLDEKFKNAVQEAKSIERIRSLLIQQNKEMLVHKYYGNASQDWPYNIKSASKSIISVLIGIAVDEEYLALDETLGDYFPDYFTRKPDDQKETIMLRNLLTMQAGLETASFHNYGRWVISDNWVEWVLGRDMIAKPGGKMVYSTGISHLLSVILTNAVGMSTKRFAQKHLFGPLDITLGGWDQDPQGYYMGGNNLALKPMDMLKIGQMMLNGGIYQGRRIVSEEWVNNTFETYTRSNFNPYNYGYMWWNKSVAGELVYFAWGFGGQYIFVVPDLEAVIVITSSLNGATQKRSYKRAVFDLLGQDIFPKIRR